jgi:hypothetical protein
VIGEAIDVAPLEGGWIVVVKLIHADHSFSLVEECLDYMGANKSGCARYNADHTPRHICFKEPPLLDLQRS